MSEPEYLTFKRAWRRHRKLPKLYSAKSLRTPPEQQFIRELHVSLGSWTAKELSQFIDEMGYEQHKSKSFYSNTYVARSIVDRVFEVWGEGNDLMCNLDTIRKVLLTKVN